MTEKSRTARLFVQSGPRNNRIFDAFEITFGCCPKDRVADLESENLHIYNRTTGRNSMASKDDLSDRFINRIGSFWRNFLPFLASKLLLI